MQHSINPALGIKDDDDELNNNNRRARLASMHAKTVASQMQERNSMQGLVK